MLPAVVAVAGQSLSSMGSPVCFGDRSGLSQLPNDAMGRDQRKVRGISEFIDA